MKKLLALTFILAIALFSLVACASFDKYEENLGSKYETDYLTSTEIDELAKTFDIDPEKYGIDKVMMVVNPDLDTYAYIIECKNRKKAEELEEKLEDVVEYYDEYYTRIDIEAESDGKFLLIGSEDIIDAATKD